MERMNDPNCAPDVSDAEKFIKDNIDLEALLKITPRDYVWQYPISERMMLLDYITVINMVEEEDLSDLSYAQLEEFCPGLLSARDKLIFRHFQSQEAQTPKTSVRDDHTGYVCTALLENGKSCVQKAVRGTCCNRLGSFGGIFIWKE